MSYRKPRALHRIGMCGLAGILLVGSASAAGQPEEEEPSRAPGVGEGDVDEPEDESFADPDELDAEGDSSDPADDDDTQVMRIDDDLDDVGADVDFTEADLATDRVDSEAKSVTRLETLALTYARLGVDTVHDEVPPALGGAARVGEETLSFRGHARAEGTTRFGRRVKVKVAGRTDAEMGLDRDGQIALERYEAHVWDTYVDLYGGWVDARIGRQIVAWGTADLLSPNDVVNARDLRRGIALEPDEVRWPVLAVSTTAYSGPLSAQLLWVPVAPVNRFELLDGDYAVLGVNAPSAAERRVGAILSSLSDDPMVGPSLQPILSIGEEPDNGIRTGEVGGQLALRTKRFDLAGYALWGHERNPRIRLESGLVEFLATSPPGEITAERLAEAMSELAMMGVPAVRVDYPRQTHLGAAMATRIEPLGLKLDAGFKPEATALLVPPDSGPLLATAESLSQIGVTASVDYDRGTQASLVIEGSHLRVLNVPAGSQVFGFDGDKLWIVAARGQWTSREGRVSLRLLGFVDVTSPSAVLKPSIRLSGHDRLAVELGVSIYEGPPGSYGGLANRNDEVWLMAEYGL